MATTTGNRYGPKGREETGGLPSTGAYYAVIFHRAPPHGSDNQLDCFGCDSDGYRDSARETASAASDAAMKSLSGRFGNGANPKLR